MIISFLCSLIIIVLVALVSGSFSFLSEKENNLLYVKEDGDEELFYRVKSQDEESEDKKEEDEKSGSQYDDDDDDDDYDEEEEDDDDIPVSRASREIPSNRISPMGRSQSLATPLGGNTYSRPTSTPIMQNNGMQNNRMGNTNRVGMRAPMSSDRVGNGFSGMQRSNRRLPGTGNTRPPAGNTRPPAGNLRESEYLDGNIKADASNTLNRIYRENREDN